MPGAHPPACAVCSATTRATKSTKSVGELYAPLTGDVVGANDAVVDDPSLVNSDPFGEGWLVKIRIDGSAPAELLDREAYVALTGGDE